MFARLFTRSPSGTDTALYTTSVSPLPTSETREPLVAATEEPEEEHPEAPSASSTEPHLNTATSGPIVEEPLPIIAPEPLHVAPVVEQTPVVHDVIAEEPSTSPTLSAGTGTVASATTAHDLANPIHHERAGTVGSIVSPADEAKILKTEAKDAKKISKIIESEGKADDKLLKTAIKEFARLQKVQKEAASEESHALSAHGKAIKLEQKLNKLCLDAKEKWEVAAADLKAKTDKLEAVKGHSHQQAELLQEKSKEIEGLRAQKAADDRERHAKLAALKNPALAAVAQQ